MKELSELEVNRFIEQGFLVVHEVFSRDVAPAILLRIWKALNIDPKNPTTWPQSFVILKEVFHERPVPQIFTPRYIGTVDDLCGSARWRASEGVGYWPVSFPDFSRAPWQPSGKWHIDCSTEERYLYPPRLGLVAFHLLSDIAPGAGGTAIRVGSHCHAARVLARAGTNSMTNLEFSRKAVAATNELPVQEATGQVGDILFLHPLTVHSTSFNHSDHIRTLGHKLFHLLEPMNFERNNFADFSPVELAIVKDLVTEF